LPNSLFIFYFGQALGNLNILNFQFIILEAISQHHKPIYFQLIRIHSTQKEHRVTILNYGMDFGQYYFEIILWEISSDIAASCRHWLRILLYRIQCSILLSIYHDQQGARLSKSCPAKIEMDTIIHYFSDESILLGEPK